MKAIAVRCTRFVVAMAAAFGLTLALLPVQSADASVNYVTICNSDATQPKVAKLWVYNEVYPNGYAVFSGGCPLFRRAGLKVEPEGNWQVRTAGGDYGRCWASQWSYPASHDKYIYKIGC